MTVEKSSTDPVDNFVGKGLRMPPNPHQHRVSIRLLKN